MLGLVIGLMWFVFGFGVLVGALIARAKPEPPWHEVGPGIKARMRVVPRKDRAA